MVPRGKKKENLKQRKKTNRTKAGRQTVVYSKDGEIGGGKREILQILS